MKTPRLHSLFALLLTAALLWCSHAPAQLVTPKGSAITDSKTGLSYRAKTRQVSAAYTVSSTEDHTILADATDAAFTITLPAAGTNFNTRVLYIQKTDAVANTVTIDGLGSEAIDGQATYALTAQYQGVLLQSGFGSWHVIGAGASATSTTNSTTWTQTSANAAALASGPNGNTNPSLRLVNNVSSAATGITLTTRAAAAGYDIDTISSGTNENIRLNAKGSGHFLVQNTATGSFLVADATNPAFSVIHTTEGTGVSVTSAAAAGGVAVTATSSGTDENLTIDAKGAGTITLNGTATGKVVVGKAQVTPQVQTISGDGAITIQSGTVLLTKGSAAAITLAAPSSQDGTIIEVTSTTDFAHVITVTGGMWDGTATTNTTATFPVVAGGAIKLIAFGTDWYVLSLQGVVCAP